MNASKRSTMRPSCLPAAPDAHPRSIASHSRRCGTGPAFVLHAVCLGALMEVRYNQMPPLPPQEMVVELAMMSPESPPANPPSMSVRPVSTWMPRSAVLKLPNVVYGLIVNVSSGGLEQIETVPPDVA